MTSADQNIQMNVGTNVYPSSQTGMNEPQTSVDSQELPVQEVSAEKKTDDLERLISSLLKDLRDEEELGKIEKSVRARGLHINVKDILQVYKKYNEVKQQYDEIRRRKHELQELVSKEGFSEEIRELGKKISDQESLIWLDLIKIETNLRSKALEIPNIILPDVKEGKDETENQVIKTVGEVRHFNFPVRNHVEIGESLDLIDLKHARKISGSRFAYLKNEAALLEIALIKLAIDVLVKEGFSVVIPPTLIKKEITDLLGYWQHGGNEDYYFLYDPIEDQRLYLVGTAEHALIPMLKDETITTNSLPLRYVAFSSSFRREAGSYGKDTKGIFRVHQFDKVEMVSITMPEDSDREHEYLLSLQERLFQLLEIPYQVVKMCSGDLGLPAARKYDIEAWIPGEGKYREVTSTSTTTDFQSRRLNIKYKDREDVGYVHMLNGTAFAIGRTIIAILENFQEEDGTVKIPEVLQKYTGFAKISPK